jgi:hypothetical protein
MKALPELEFLTNMFGYVNDEIKERIVSYLETPTFGQWDDIQSIIISSGMTSTIWQWVLEVDPTFPRRGRGYGEQMRITREWERIPEPETVITALKLAAAKNTGIKF